MVGKLFPLPGLAVPPGCAGTTGKQYAAPSKNALGMFLMHSKVVAQPECRQAGSVGKMARDELLGAQLPSFMHSHLPPSPLPPPSVALTESDVRLRLVAERGAMSVDGDEDRGGGPPVCTQKTHSPFPSVPITMVLALLSCAAQIARSCHRGQCRIRCG